MSDVILIVEDEPRMREVLRDYFAAHGVAADLAADGGEALELFSGRDYDAVLLDVMMPGLDGYAVCRALRRESAALIRRSRGTADGAQVCGAMRMDPARRMTTVGNMEV